MQTQRLLGLEGNTSCYVALLVIYSYCAVLLRFRALVHWVL